MSGSQNIRIVLNLRVVQEALKYKRFIIKFSIKNWTVRSLNYQWEPVIYKKQVSSLTDKYSMFSGHTVFLRKHEKFRTV